MWHGVVILCMLILVKKGMKMEVTFGEQSFPCTAVDVPANRLTGSSPSGPFLLLLALKAVQVMYQFSLDCKVIPWSSVCLERKTSSWYFTLLCPMDWGILFVLGLWDFFSFCVLHVYLVFIHLFFQFKYLTCFDGEEHDGITCRDRRIVSKQLNSGVILFNLYFNLM